MAWSHFTHGADIGVRGSGATRETAFAEAAVALTAVITDPARVKGRIPVEVACAAPDDAILLMDWLNALVREMAVRRMLFSRFDVTLAGHSLRATAWGEAVDQARHQPAVEVKGATLTAMDVGERNGVWTAQCVVDV